MPLLHSGNFDIHYQWHPSSNEGVPTLVLLHGFLEEMSMWEPFLDSWNAHANLLRIDLPGHGKSKGNAGVHTMDLMAECIHDLLDHLGLQRVLLLGHSMGGYVGLSFVEHYPEYVQSLCLLCSSTSEDSAPRKVMRDKAAALVQRSKKAFVRSAIPQLFTPELRDAHRSAIEYTTARAMEMEEEGIVGAILGMKARHDFSRILYTGSGQSDFSVGLIFGTTDELVPVEKPLEWKNAPLVRFAYQSPGGHMAHITDQKGVLNAVVNWLGQ